MGPVTGSFYWVVYRRGPGLGTSSDHCWVGGYLVVTCLGLGGHLVVTCLGLGGHIAVACLGLGGHIAIACLEFHRVLLG